MWFYVMTDKLINKCKYVYIFTENWATRILYWAFNWDIIICRISGEKWRCDCVTCHVVTLWILRGSVNFIWDSWRHVNHKWWCHLLMLLFFIIYFYIKQEKSRVRQIRYIRFTNDPLRVQYNRLWIRPSASSTMTLLTLYGSVGVSSKPKNL